MRRWAQEKEAAATVPIGRHTVVGSVIKTEYRENRYGTTLKMLVKSDEGFKLWGTVPSALEVVEETKGENGDSWTEQRGLERGDRIQFTATLEPSADDPKFGFYKRPTKAQCPICW